MVHLGMGSLIGMTVYFSHLFFFSFCNHFTSLSSLFEFCRMVHCKLTCWTIDYVPNQFSPAQSNLIKYPIQSNPIS